jgi:hypothetical protein
MKYRALPSAVHATGAVALLMIATTASLAPVQVASAQTRPAIVREVDSPMRGNRYSESVQVIFDTGQFLVSQSVTPAIPAGKKLYLQSVSTHTLLTDGQSLMEVRLTVNPLIAARFWVSQEFQATATGSANPQRHFTGNQELGVVVNPGETVEIRLFRNDDLGAGALNFSNVTLHGFFVDAT